MQRFELLTIVIDVVENVIRLALTILVNVNNVNNVFDRNSIVE